MLLFSLRQNICGLWIFYKLESYGANVLMRPISIVLAVVFFVNCTNKVPDSLLGRWEKDSSTNGPAKKLSRPYESAILVLKKDGTFDYKWSADDVGGKEHGKFIVKDSADGFKILELINTKNRFRYCKILEADNYRLKTSHKNSYGVDDSTIYFDMIDVFKKIN